LERGSCQLRSGEHLGSAERSGNPRVCAGTAPATAATAVSATVTWIVVKEPLAQARGFFVVARAFLPVSCANPQTAKPQPDTWSFSDLIFPGPRKSLISFFVVKSNETKQQRQSVCDCLWKSCITPAWILPQDRCSSRCRTRVWFYSSSIVEFFLRRSRKPSGLNRRRLLARMFAS